MEEFFDCLKDIRDSLKRLEADLGIVQLKATAEKAVTVDECAELFNCSRESVLQNLRRAGSPGMKTGAEKKSEWRIYPSEYAAFLKELAKTSKAV